MMEPLQTLLHISEDKHKDLIHYLPSETTSHLTNHEYIDTSDSNQDLYLNESVTCVSKETGLITLSGKILKITEDTLTIKQGYRNLYTNIHEVYIFRKLRKSRDTKNDRGFYEALLNIF